MRVRVHFSGRQNLAFRIAWIYHRVMSQALPKPPPGFDALSIDDKIDYVQSLWDRIAAKPEDVPVPDWHREIINEGLAAHRTNNDQGKEWKEVEREITAELSNPTK
jgi:putative addiction module component (TIGR02574 family)